MKRQSEEIGPCKIQMLKLAGKDFKAAILTMCKDINIYIKNQ